MPQDGSSSVRAVVRVRPLLPHEVERGVEACCEVPDDHSILVQGGSSGSKWRQYTFDACLARDRSQKQVFQESGVTSLLDAALTGYSSTVLAYGQTGSGKTYTMMGRLGGAPEAGKNEDTSKEDGLVVRSAKSLFRRISSGKGMPDTTYSVSASFTEIFNAPGAVNECICDLLNTSAGNLQVRHNKKHGFFVSDLSVVDCHSAADVRAVLEAGLQNRRVAAHALNKDSSRSHALFTMYIDAETACDESDLTSTPARRYGKITFVDLAGSERLKESAAEGHTRKETQAINKSLFILGQVISQLATGKADQHVPYRNSKLTQLLQDSFNGESLCLMVTCISPSAQFAEESLNSLKYATKAMHISLRNRPVVRMDERQRLVHDLKSENAALRQELGCYRAKFGELAPEDLLHPVDLNSACVERPCEGSLAIGMERQVSGGAVSEQLAGPGPHSLPPSCPGSHHGSRPASREAAQRKSGHNASPAAASQANSPGLSPGQCQAPLQPDGSPQDQRRGRSLPPRRASRPAPPPVAVEQPPVPGRSASEGPNRVAGYAIVAARRKQQTERPNHHPPRRRPPQAAKGAPVGLPPIPRPPASGNSIDDRRSSAGDAVLELTDALGPATPEAQPGTRHEQPGIPDERDERALRALRRGSGIADGDPQPEAAATNADLPSPVVKHGPSSGIPSNRYAQPMCPGDNFSSGAPMVPVIRAPTSSKVASGAPVRQPRLQASCSDLARLSQIQKLDSLHRSEWQFHFGEHQGDGKERAEGSRTASACSSVSRSARSPGLPPRHPTHCSFSRDSSRGSLGSSSRAASPNDSLMGDQVASSALDPMSPPALDNRASFASKVPTTASDSPSGECPRPHLSLIELNSKLSSMQLATSALLSAQNI